ncbi:cytochrome P450 [Talaromyces proteolyticus]|uniref:Cytochrome P450 n=1 Tax=Talaromyces proteolyticus TaxID=1131652 RepID=A0AAD4KZH6_9EURO|nr:cytochrome P450 [Talaromyces proteolyticus]KAH8703478.1 cytochrome P450 [Talaromyces proteolyticus]
MAVILIDAFHYLGHEAAKRPIFLLISSVLLGGLYFIYLDFLKTWLKRPSHFSQRSLLARFTTPKFDAPLVELKPGETYREVLARGSATYPDRPYKIKHFPDEIIILPSKCVDDIKTNAQSTLSFQESSYDFFIGEFTGITGHEQATATLIRRDVGRLLDQVYEIVQDAALNAILEEIGPCEGLQLPISNCHYAGQYTEILSFLEWTEIVLFPRIVKMIIRISQRVFVGERLSKDPDWLQAIQDCTGGAFSSVPKLWRIHWLFRPFVAWSLPQLRAIRKHRAKATTLLRPILEERLEAMKDPKFKPPPDLIQLVIDGSPNNKGNSLDYQVSAQIGTGRAALFTTASTVYHLLYDLCLRPEYIEPLRQEALEVGEVSMTRANVAKLAKLDSFIREAQRFNKFMLVGTIRKVVKPLKIATGETLPAGVICGLDTHTIHFDRSPLKNPYEFDGYRYYNMRSEPGNEQKFQAVTSGPDHLVFGYGTQACPGRFFAIHEAKVVVARILRNYEFKLKDPPKEPSVLNGLDGILNKVDPTVKFVFKHR